MNAKKETDYWPAAGDIVWLDLNPRTGHEQSGRRPCLIISEPLLTDRTSLAIICPITSQIKGLPFEIPLAHTETAGAVLPIHVRSVDLRARFPQFIEKVSVEILAISREYVKVIAGINE